MTPEQNRGFLIDRRDAAQSLLQQLDASQETRRQPLRAEIQLAEALLEDSGPGDDREFRGSLENLLLGRWRVPNSSNESAVRYEAERLLTLLRERQPPE